MQGFSAYMHAPELPCAYCLHLFLGDSVQSTMYTLIEKISRDWEEVHFKVFAVISFPFDCQFVYIPCDDYNTSVSLKMTSHSPNFCPKILSNVTSPIFVRCLCITLRTLKNKL